MSLQIAKPPWMKGLCAAQKTRRGEIKGKVLREEYPNYIGRYSDDTDVGVFLLRSSDK
jgi:hypothetical protein